MDSNYNVKVFNSFPPLQEEEIVSPSAPNSKNLQQPPETLPSCNSLPTPTSSIYLKSPKIQQLNTSFNLKPDFELIRLELAKVTKTLEENQEKLLKKEWVKKVG